MDFQTILENEFLGNSVQNYLLAVGIFVVGWLFHGWFASLIVTLINQLFRRSEFRLTRDEFKALLRKPLNLFLFLIFFYISVSILKFPEEWELSPPDEFGFRMILQRTYYALLALAIIRVALKVVTAFGMMLRKKAETTTSKQDDQLIPFVMDILRVVVAVLGILVVLSSVFKLNIGALVAGLGIGGLAIALAAKESLENLLGSFTIFFDKPFVVGDFVKVGGTEGVVEKVGFRSTRIRTPEKSYLTIPNRNMISAELDNMSLRTFRRVRFNIGLVYGTKMDVLKSVSAEIQKFIDEHENTNQDGKVKFMDFGASSLDIMVMYYIDTMDFDEFLRIKEEINYKIMEIVERHETDFAFPTQTIHLQKEIAG